MQMINEIIHEIHPRGPGQLPTFTPGEPWTLKRGLETFYAAGADFALEALGDGNGRSCLVVGSPIFEALQLQERGWDVTYLDIRKPPEGVKWIEGDASEMPFGDKVFDALSSTCVMCHMGLGRYGDTVKTNGDFKMLSEVKRVVKPGGLCAVMVGPVADCGQTRRLGTMHKVYAIADVLKLFGISGLKMVRAGIWSNSLGRWLERSERPTNDIESPDYLSMLVHA